MIPDTELEERFERAQNVLSHVSSPLARIGLWPMNVTTCSRIKLLVYLLYHGTRTLLEIIELIMVFGNLQLVVDNLVLTGTQITIMLRVTTLRFNKMTYRVINGMNRLKKLHNFENSMEMEIFIRHSESTRRFYKMMLLPVITCSSSWFITPLFNHIIGKMQNRTVPLIAPWHMPPFVDMSRLDVAIAVYIMEIPMLYSGFCYLTTYSIHFTFINDICAQLIILSNRIRHLKGNELTDIRKTLAPLIKKHVAIIKIVKQLDACTNLPLLFELFNTTLLIGLCSYNIMKNIGTSDKTILFNYLTFMLILLILVYINCSMGQSLDDQTTNLFMAFGECRWNKLPTSFHKAQLICMLQAQTPLLMTAGHFYKFSLSGFTRILRTSMTYVSMLRKLI